MTAELGEWIYPDSFTIRTSGRNGVIDVWYEREIKVLPGWTINKEFEYEAEQPLLQFRVLTFGRSPDGPCERRIPLSIPRRPRGMPRLTPVPCRRPPTRRSVRRWILRRLSHQGSSG